MDTANFIVEEVTSTRALREHWHQWCRLHEARLEDDLCSDPDYLAAELDSFGRSVPFRMLFVYHGHGTKRRLVGCFPLGAVRPGPTGALVTASWWGSSLSPLTQPLLHRDYGSEALRAASRWFAAPNTGIDVLEMPLVNLESATWRLWASHLERIGAVPLPRHESVRPTLRRYGSLDEYLADLSPRRRKNYRRLWRALNDAGEVRVVVHRGPETSPDLPRQFMQMEMAGWKGRENTALACSLDSATFFPDIVDRFKRRGELFCVDLQLDGRSVAMSCSFVVGATLFGFKIAHDPEFGDFSPGTLAAVQEVNAFLAAPELERGDSGSTAQSFIRSYWPQRERIARVLVPLTRKGRLALRGLQAAVWIKQQMKEPATPDARNRLAS